MLQFDIVLQKENLRPLGQVHASMHMPTHGEFLIERLCAAGLQLGLVFGLDDFSARAELLNSSPAQVLIVCGADQHHSEAFLTAWQGVQKTYDYQVLITSEPIYSPLAFWMDEYHNARAVHERFIENFMPDLVMFCSRFDLEPSQRKYRQSFQRGFYSLADPAFFTGPQLPWADKQQALLFMGKPMAWVYSRLQEGWNRFQQLDYFATQPRIPFAGYVDSLSWRECYQVSNRYRFQLQPRSGYFFHTARALQCALTGTVPIILLPSPDVLPWLQGEAPVVRPGHNLLVAFDGEYEPLIDILADSTRCEQIAAAGHELLALGTTQESITHLAQMLQVHFA